MLRILWQYIGEESRGDDSYITCWSLHWKNNTVLPETENMAASHIPKNRVFNSFYVCSQDDMPQYRQYMRNKIAEYCSITSGWWWKLIVPVKAHPASLWPRCFKISNNVMEFRRWNCRNHRTHLLSFLILWCHFW